MASEEEAAKLRDAVKDFQPGAAGQSVGDDALNALRWVADTGRNSLPWEQVRAVIRAHVASLLGDESQIPEGGRREDFQDARTAVLEIMDSLDKAPFTLQRLCELITASDVKECRPEKLVWALQKLVTVSSMQPVDVWPYEDAQTDAASAAKAAEDGKPVLRESDIALPARTSPLTQESQGSAPAGAAGEDPPTQGTPADGAPADEAMPVDGAEEAAAPAEGSSR
eukprot:TRINITY_DN50371_c0_g1_i1.p1 TRINITY_DN50371_c0_g1~~TRINITY_DN50371_c0_g1_i1.p1  ORF type:complete len:253 (+),score=79.14 TRINITY_DN50371_c0_g1_i1:85-759(+)